MPCCTMYCLLIGLNCRCIILDFNIITYQFSLLPFACLACLCAGLCSRTLVCTHYPTRCVDLLISTYVILSFCDFILVYCLKSHQSFFTKVVFPISPPRVLSLTFHFSLYSSPFLTFFSQLASPACFCSLCGLCFAVGVQVSWTEGVLCFVCYSSFLIPHKREKQMRRTL